ncbi:MAG: HD domain-containing protein [Isosphaeraceae bacterium]|nr:HD domain-containing protein [Isosphaeraceae bacterium]
MNPEHSEVVATILRLFAERGESDYGGEEVTQLEHALQAAHFAKKSGQPSSLVVASLLHDIGHLLHDLPSDSPEHGIDDRHEELGRKWLAHYFGPDVVEPVRLHVEAKRYLCAVEPTYLAKLSGPSLTSLQLQGGPMSEAEVAEFRSSPFFEQAVLLRRYDEAAKVRGMDVAPIDAYVDDLDAALIPADS